MGFSFQIVTVLACVAGALAIDYGGYGGLSGYSAPLYHASAPLYHASAPLYHAPAAPLYHAPAAPLYQAPVYAPVKHQDYYVSDII